MSASAAFGSAVVFNGVSYPRLQMESYGEVEGAVREARVAAFKQMCRDCEVKDPATKLEMMSKQRPHEVAPADIHDYVLTKDGASFALTVSLKVAGKTDSEIEGALKTLLGPDASGIALRVLGFVEEPMKDRPLPGSPPSTRTES